MYALLGSLLSTTDVASSASSNTTFSTAEYGRRCAHLFRLDDRIVLGNMSFSSSAKNGTSSEALSVSMCFILRSMLLARQGITDRNEIVMVLSRQKNAFLGKYDMVW